MNVPIINHINSSRKTLDLFTPNDIKIIQKTLEENVINTKCIPRGLIFDAIESLLSRRIKKNVFCLGLTQAILDNIINGFKLKKGRTGGIYRVDGFSSSVVQNLNKCMVFLDHTIYYCSNNSSIKESA